MAVVLILSSVFPPVASAAGKYKTLYKFKVCCGDAAFPEAGLIFDKAGNLYGTTYYGGDYGVGTVFRLTSKGNGNWKENLIHSFIYDGKDGFAPSADMIFDGAGNLYGTTEQGGVYNYGTVFELSPNGDGTWRETVLHSFNRTDGSSPMAGLIFDPVGNLYGTAVAGEGGYGNVFQLTPNGHGGWTESVLHWFNGADGKQPFAGSAFDQAGNLYGTTEVGGDYGDYGGTVFQLSPNGDGTWSETVLHSFNRDGEDGYHPLAGLIFDRAGSLYGTTGNGGRLDCGTVFKLSPNGDGSWVEAILHSFNCRDGESPQASLIFDEAGNLYGTTASGGGYSFGTVFKLRPIEKGRWKETVLHSFKDLAGAVPLSGLIFDGHGRLFGTTRGDTLDTVGSVFMIAP